MVVPLHFGHNFVQPYLGLLHSAVKDILVAFSSSFSSCQLAAVAWAGFHSIPPGRIRQRDIYSDANSAIPVPQENRRTAKETAQGHALAGTFTGGFSILEKSDAGVRRTANSSPNYDAERTDSA
jgi:hypothetical protein